MRWHMMLQNKTKNASIDLVNPWFGFLGGMLLHVVQRMHEMYYKRILPCELHVITFEVGIVLQAHVKFGEALRENGPSLGGCAPCA
jgi:hypothetical protein